MFVDQVKITVTAGKGGNGCLSFRREKYVPKGGPDGGDGGDGGNIIFQVDTQLHTLLDFRYQRHYKASDGKHGQGANKFGKCGIDLIIKVPQGTVVKNVDTDTVLADLVEDNQRFVIAKGGRGGRGNAKFATPTNQAPRKFEPGTAGEYFSLQLELKLMADVGLVGFPNVGKSTLLSVISAAHPKIADYPFTTLTPNLGIVRFKEEHSYVVADIPGLIEGAHLGKGLGIQFLRHIERTRILAFLIDAQSENIKGELDILRNELKKYNSFLLLKSWILILTKIDLIPASRKKILSKLMDSKIEWRAISSATGEGLEELKAMFWKLLNRLENIDK